MQAFAQCKRLNIPPPAYAGPPPFRQGRLGEWCGKQEFTKQRASNACPYKKRLSGCWCGKFEFTDTMPARQLGVYYGKLQIIEFLQILSHSEVIICIGDLIGGFLYAVGCIGNGNAKTCCFYH